MKSRKRARRLSRSKHNSNIRQKYKSQIRLEKGFQKTKLWSIYTVFCRRIYGGKKKWEYMNREVKKAQYNCYC